MLELTLYCKSYRNDLLRLVRLAQSIHQFNADSIPFYVSVPENDFTLFEASITGLNIHLIKDEAIIHANPRMDIVKIMNLPGGISQQIVKSEFWRLGISKSYLCLDSDCVFVRPFYLDDFLLPDGHPYTVMHEAKEFLQFALNHNQQDTYNSFHRLRAQLMDLVERRGRHFDFGPVPVLWHGKVWQELDTHFLQPRNLNFYDAIMLLPSELLWYGEAMLKFKPFPLVPVEPLFKVYHNESQYIYGRRQGDSIERIAKNFLGICYQSNWQKELDLVKKPLPSRIARWVRMQISKLR